jgi:hypothetical protein
MLGPGGEGQDGEGVAELLLSMGMGKEEVRAGRPLSRAIPSARTYGHTAARYRHCSVHSVRHCCTVCTAHCATLACRYALHCTILYCTADRHLLNHPHAACCLGAHRRCPY